MATESIIDYKRPGFPVISDTGRGFQTVIEYVGPDATLKDALPDLGAAWGNYTGTVANRRYRPLENSGFSELVITVEAIFDSSTAGSGTLRETVLEVEWVMFERSMLEHPEFRVDGGGSHELDAFDIADIEAWRDEPNPKLKGEYQYDEFRVSGSGSVADLSANSKKFAQGVELGQETYEDYAPVIRRTRVYIGGLPPQSEAGAKSTPPSFTGVPSGYEWRKSSDRSVRTGRQNRWEKVEEWVGAIKILSDKNSIYW